MTKQTWVTGSIRIIEAVWENASLAVLAGLMISMTLATATAEDAPWWVSAAAIKRVTLKSGTHFPQLPLDPAKASAALDGLRADGISAVEIFAPADGGRSFDGLDHKDLFRIDPELGTMDDFRRLVKLIHEKAMPVVAFVNLGYSSVDAPEFLKACDDMKAGRKTRETSLHIWAETGNAPPPIQAPGDTVFMVRPTHLPGGKPGTFYNSEKDEFWQWSERAGKFYWTKWAGVDSKGNKVRLPQYNWQSPAVQEEMAKAIHFWMDTGLDGMVIDAVNWYNGCTWEISRRYMTGVIASYGSRYAQPEGGGGFHEDPVSWIVEGGWNSVQDYGLGIWWEKGSSVIENALANGDPRPIERALRDYHDRVVAVGGALYASAPPFDDVPKYRLAWATVALAGDLLSVDGSWREGDEEMRWLLRTKAAHAALHQLSSRRQLRTGDDARQYAFLRTAPDGSERILAVLNFQPTPQEVVVDLSPVATSGLIDLRDGKRFQRQVHLHVPLPAYGYKVLQVLK